MAYTMKARGYAGLLVGAIGSTFAAFSSSSSSPSSSSSSSSSNVLMQKGEPIVAGATLRKVVIVHRHGDRTPITKQIGEEVEDVAFWKSTLPTRSIVDEMYAPYDLKREDILDDDFEGEFSRSVSGKLTTKGFRDLVRLGESLRVRYQEEIPFLSADDDIFNTRSTPLSRCVQSAIAILNGLRGGEDVKGEWRHHRTAIRFGDVNPTRPFDRESMWPRNALCAAQKLLAASIRAQRSSEDASAEKKLLEQCRSIFDVSNDDSAGVTSSKGARNVPLVYFAEVLHCRTVHGYAWPNAHPTDASLVERISTHIMTRQLRNFEANETHLRFYAGRILGEVASGLLAKDRSKWVHFSGHDSTMIPILAALRVDTNNSFPTYGSNVIVELWERSGCRAEEADDEDCIVQVFYNGQLDRRCTLKEFKRIVGRYLYPSADAYDSECAGEIGKDPTQNTREV